MPATLHEIAPWHHELPAPALRGLRLLYREMGPRNLSLHHKLLARLSVAMFDRRYYDECAFIVAGGGWAQSRPQIAVKVARLFRKCLE